LKYDENKKKEKQNKRFKFPGREVIAMEAIFSFIDSK